MQMDKKKKKAPTTAHTTEATKSIRKDIVLILVSATVTAILSVTTTILLNRYNSPKLIIDRAFFVPYIEPEVSLPSVSKIRITNDGSTTIHNLSIPISKDAFSREPSITVDLFTKYTIEDYPYYSIVNIPSLAPSGHTVITVFGICIESISEQIAKNYALVEDRPIGALPIGKPPDWLIGLPFLGTLSADEGPTTKIRNVEAEEILKQEIQDGFIANRFVFFTLRPEGQKANHTNDLVNVVLAEASSETNPPKMFKKGDRFIPKFNTVLVPLCAKNEKGSKINYTQSFGTFAMENQSSVTKNIMLYYFDILTFYDPDYSSIIYIKPPNGGREVAISSTKGILAEEKQ